MLLHGWGLVANLSMRIGDRRLLDVIINGTQATLIRGFDIDLEARALLAMPFGTLLILGDQRLVLGEIHLHLKGVHLAALGL